MNGGNITDAYSKGEISGNRNVGGLIGNFYSGTITNTYSIAKVIGKDTTNGLSNNMFGIANSSYWTKTKAEVTTSGLGTELTLEKMAQQDSYIGWDFETIWIMKEFPELR